MADELSRAPLTWPLDGDALEDLRWYLEDYLAAPYGVWEDRGPQVQAGLAGWGEAVFASIFGAGPAREGGYGGVSLPRCALTASAADPPGPYTARPCAVMQRSKEMGVEIVMPRHRNPPDGNGGPNHWEFWIRDPDGYVVVVASPYGTAGGTWRPGQ